MATVLVFAGSLLVGPQAFGVVMMNFDEHVLDAGPVVGVLFGMAGLAPLLYVTACVLSRRRAARAHWALSTGLFAVVIVLELANMRDSSGLVRLAVSR